MRVIFQSYTFKLTHYEEIAPIEINFSNPDNPNDGNIELRSIDGIQFTICTEVDELTSIETVENLKLVLNQS